MVCESWAGIDRQSRRTGTHGYPVQGEPLCPYPEARARVPEIIETLAGLDADIRCAKALTARTHTPTRLLLLIGETLQIRVVVPRRVGPSTERGLKRGSGAQVGTEGFGLRGDTAASRGTFRAFGVVAERHATNESAEVARAERDHGRAVRGRVLASFDAGTFAPSAGKASGATESWSALPVGVVSESA